MNKKPKLFSFSRETEEKHINAMVVEPEKREILYEIIDSFIEIIEKEKLNAKSLEPFIQGLKTNDKYVWDVAGSRLVKLSHYYDEASKVIKELANDKSVNIRYRVIASLEGHPPLSLAKELLQEGLRDKSKKVRAKTADVIFLLKLTELQDSLKIQLANEKDNDVKNSIQFALKEITN
ncbi:HEAT repeat domain-containing protein [Neobacillus drentensis]|uniref:HEAT repeat domain-containing protein n=1 Tax=Neobacillus drentensis TaxID=220684 RepID=UPI002FFE1CFD